MSTVTVTIVHLGNATVHQSNYYWLIYHIYACLYTKLILKELIGIVSTRDLFHQIHKRSLQMSFLS